MFHAATAALLHRDIRRRSHKGLISAFGEFLVKPGLVAPELRRHFGQAFDLRQQSDYQPLVDLTDKDADEMLNRARHFIKACQQLVR